MAAPETKRTPAFSRTGDYYNYTPCLIQEDERTRHVFYCANRTAGDVTDYICYRRANLAGGDWKWGSEQVALAPAEKRAEWDSRHVCDPEVVAGRFRYQGREWPYALFYLGCDAEDCTHNQVGVAFANALAGPWIKYPHPIVTYTSDPSGGIVRSRDGWPIYRYWGVGQPAAVSLDGKGKVWLFYSRGEEVGGAEMVEMDLTDMDTGPISGPRRKIPVAGLHDGQGKPLQAFGNLTIIYDRKGDEYFMAREGDLPPADGKFPTFVSTFVQLARIPGNDLRRGKGTWQVIADLDEEATGWPRNHNTYLLRDLRGERIDTNHLTLGISVAEAFDRAPEAFRWLWTYRIVLLDIPLREPKAG